MDKKIWLKVIREELGLLDELASVMIQDTELTKEEVELAITRSRMITREFEMLHSHIPETDSAKDFKVEFTVPSDTEASMDELVPVVAINGEVQLSLEAAKEDAPDVLSLPPSVSPSSSLPPSLPEPVPHKSIFPTPEKEESTLLNIETKEEEHTIYKSAPIKSLKEGLILNDRYLFQRELFSNDKSRLDETIDALDRLKNIQEAVDYLKANFKWTKNEASEKFVKLVKRRFP